MDEAGLLSPAARTELTDELRTYPPLLQLQIWIVQSLEGEPIESLSIRAADQWKLGTEKKDNGVLVLVSIAERRSRIEVGQGLEGVVPDALAGRILRNVLAPRMRAGRAGTGLMEVAQVIHALANKEIGADDGKLSDASAKPRKSYLALFVIVMIVIFITRLMDSVSSGPTATLLGGVTGSRIRRKRGGFFDGGFGGGGGFGSGGGGWSGGGGGFSGGGSSGGW